MGTASYTVKGDTPTMDQLFISNFQQREKEVIDQIFLHRPALAKLLEWKDTKMLGAGGEQFEIPVQTGTNPNGGMIDPDTGLSLDDYDPLDMLLYDPKYAAYNLRWGLNQKAVNKGKNVVFKLIDQKIQNTIETLRDTLNDQLWNGSGSGLNTYGLSTLVPATAKASQSTAIGGKNPSSNAWWRSQYKNATGLSSATYFNDIIEEVYNNIEANGGMPDCAFCDERTLRYFTNYTLDALRLKPTKIGNKSFDLYQYRNMPIIFDINAPEGEMRLIGKDAIKFCVDPDYWMSWTGWKELPDVPFASVRQIVCRFAIARCSARTVACIDNIDTV
jgi:hypothetical protein